MAGRSSLKLHEGIAERRSSHRGVILQMGADTRGWGERNDGEEVKIDERFEVTRTTGRDQENVNVWIDSVVPRGCSVSSVRSGQWAIQHERAQ